MKKIYQSNKKEITDNRINFEEFLDLYVELKISQFIKSNLLYKTYFNSDRLADSTIVNMCLVNKGINNSFNEITLEPQVINYLKINYGDNFTIGTQFALTLLLKKNISY